MQALPITFGHKAAIWLSEMGRNYERMRELEKRVFVGGMVGAVGTQASFGPQAPELEARVMKRNGGGFEPSYNVQISTDAAAGIIIRVDVTQSGADAPHLQPALLKPFRSRELNSRVDTMIANRKRAAAAARRAPVTS